MDSQNLRAFIAVAETNSFSQAGEKLHLTQPAVSKRIANLEAHLNLKLFDRIGRKVSLTEAGLVLLPNAQKIIQDVNETQRQLADLSGQVRGSLHIATSHHIGLHRLPPVIETFSKHYPDVDLNLTFLDSDSAYTQVLQGHLDLAVITLTPDIHPSLQAKEIWEDKLHFVVGHQHPLLQTKQRERQQKNRIGLKALSEFPAILPELSTYTSQLVANQFGQSNLDLQIKLTTNNLETIKMLVGINMGWSVLPESMLGATIHSLSVAKVNLRRHLGLVHHRERNLGNAAHAFIELLSQSASLKL